MAHPSRPMLLRVRAAAVRAGLIAAGLLLAACSESPAGVRISGGDADRGRVLIERYGCTACHAIPGIPGHGASFGPPLVQLPQRGYLAGVLPNTQEHVVRWLRDPPSVAPNTLMPNLGVSAAEATDIAAYLYRPH